MAVSTLTHIAVLDASNNLSNLNAIIEGSDNATEFIFNEEGSFVRVKDNQEKLAKLTGTLQGAMYGTSSDESAVLADAISGTISKVAGYGQELCFLMNEPQDFSFVRKNNGSIESYTLRAQKDYLNGYNSAGLKHGGIVCSANLLSLYNVLAGDGEDLFGFTTSDDLLRVNFGVGVYLEEQGTGTAFYRSQNIFFPFAGQSITVSFLLASSSSASNSIGIAFLDASGVAIGGSGVTTAITTVAGIKSTSAVAPVGTYYVRMFTGIVLNGTLEFSKPMISINGNTTFVL